jgi:copper chaperone NosL
MKNIQHVQKASINFSLMNQLSNKSRLLIALGSAMLVVVYFVPFWSIYLVAPQYPEGLSMQIWLYKLTGQVEIINGLNHYIGMKHIKAEMFPEFDFLVYVFGAYILFGFVVAYTGSRRLLLGYLGLFVAGGIAAFIDFYKWGYDYGHDLDPTAAIQVPGLTYQPPLIGHKRLLNFDAYSYPDTGCWIVVAVVGLFFILWFIGRKKMTVTTTGTVTNRSGTIVTFLACALLLAGCSRDPQPIVIGKDVCAECKMTIADAKFGGEIVTKKGKVYKFDDVHCLAAYLEEKKVDLADLHHTLFVNYEKPGEFVRASAAEFVLSSKLKSPMNGNAAAFESKQRAEQVSATIEGSRTTNWSTLYNILIK